MKTTKNYLSLLSTNVVQLHGFDEIKDCYQVEIFKNGRYLLFVLNQREDSEQCFSVSIEKDRRVYNEKLYNLVKENNLDNKLFLYDEKFHHYLSSSIENN